MTVFLICLSILICLIMFVGAFYLAKYVIKIKLQNEQLQQNYKCLDDKEKIELILRNEHLEKHYKHVDDREKIELIIKVELLETNYKLAIDHIKEQEETIIDLNQTVEQFTYETQTRANRTTQPRSWNPQDILNTEERER